MKFELSFTNKEITPWGGMVFLKQMLEKIGFREQIEKCESLPVSLSNNSHKKEVLLESFITSIWCGANRFLHTEVTRADKALEEYLVGKKLLLKMLISVILVSLHKVQINKLAAIFLVGFFRI